MPEGHDDPFICWSDEPTPMDSPCSQVVEECDRVAGAFLVYDQQILERTADIHRRQGAVLARTESTDYARGPEVVLSSMRSAWEASHSESFRIARSRRGVVACTVTLSAEKLRDYGANTIKAGSGHVVRATSIDNGQ